MSTKQHTTSQTQQLGIDLLEFWLSKQPGAVFYSPPEVIRGLLPVGLLQITPKITPNY